MGCQSSQIQKPLGIRINILDSNFTKQSNSKIRQKMDKLDIKYQVYLSLSCFIQDMIKIYTNQIIVVEQLLDQLIKQLQRASFHPNIYVIKQSQTQQSKLQNLKFPIKYFKNYEQIVTLLTQKTHKKRISGQNPVFQKNKQHLVLKIFRKKSNKSSQQLIFQQTLKSKNITYQIYQTFSQLQESIEAKNSHFIVTDYVYHRQVVNLVQGSNTRVICFCEFEKEETYDPKSYFITNNFLQIVSEIVSQQKVSNLNLVKCSKVYIYSSQVNSLSQYAENIEHFDFQVKIYSDLNTIIKESKYFFAVTIIINPEQRKEVEKFLQSNDYLFKTKIVEIKKGTENTVKGLRKAIKQLKKGYRASKGLAKTIDIIDKHFDNIKFDTIKKQLDKYDIKCYGYTNLSDYIKGKKFMSPFIICNYQQRSLVVRYLKQIRSQCRIILFCNKNYISSQLKQNKVFAFVSSHFGKIINYIKKNNVYNPCIMDENDIEIKNKKQKLNKNNKRISALNWCNQLDNVNTKNNNSKDLLQQEKNFQFLNVNISSSSSSQIYSIQKQFAGLFNLEYSPLQYQQKIKQNFSASLRKLKSLLKVNYPQGEFQKLLSQINKLNTHQLINKILSFFSSSNQMGVKINKSLINVQSLGKQEIACLKQYLLYVNLNYLSVYRDNFIGKVKLYHYLQSELIQKCQVGSSILNKNYSIFYQSQGKQNITQSITSYIVQLELQANTITQKNPEINSYFRYKEKFVFCPYSQFEIKSIYKRTNHTVLQVQYKKNVDYLKCYFSQNLHKMKPSLLNAYQEQILKYKTSTKTSFLFDESNKDTFSRNVLRTKALNCYHSNKLQDAIKYQKQLIIREQSIQNFDSAKQEWLNYQLACFYNKIQNSTESKRILKQLMEAEPSEFLREKIKQLNKIRRGSRKSSLGSNFGKQLDTNIKNIDLGSSNKMKNRSGQFDNVVDNSQVSQQQDLNIFEGGQLQQQIQCLDLQMLQQFENEQKENRY